jgi:4-amino-4-deoxy-L-arabinose transferase-like glycosyltransferase
MIEAALTFGCLFALSAFWRGQRELGLITVVVVSLGVGMLFKHHASDVLRLNF